MKKYLLIAEKLSFAKTFKEAYNEIQDSLNFELEILPLTMMVFPEDTNLFKIDECLDKEELVIKNRPNIKKHYIVSPYYKENLKIIEKKLLENEYDLIVNGCDCWEPGDLAFEKAMELLNMPMDKTHNLIFSSLVYEHIKDVILSLNNI